MSRAGDAKIPVSEPLHQEARIHVVSPGLGRRVLIPRLALVRARDVTRMR